MGKRKSKAKQASTPSPVRSGRDEFTNVTKRLLAGRVAYRCSKPGCNSPTIGPQKSGAGVINLGNAAHITAAGKKGPRRNDSLTSEERRAPANGIWLCIQHANHVDQDDEYYTVETLQQWKRDAEGRADLDRPTDRPIFEPDDLEREFLASLGLPADDNTDTVMQRLITAARQDLQSYIELDGRSHPIALSLRVNDCAELKSLPRLGAALERWEHLTIIAPPGTGKTTTLIQLGQDILAQENAVAVLVPLSVWSLRSEGLLEYLPRLSAYRPFQPQHFMLLAHFGRLVLLLDGWNEVGLDARLKCITELQSLRRQYPMLGIAVTTRASDGIPVKGPKIAIEPLSEAQQLAIARELRGDEGETILDRAWRTPGVRDLITIPLYLTAVLAAAGSANLPTTKEEILRLFVHQHEAKPERVEARRVKLDRFHRHYLEGLAVEGVGAGTTSLPVAKARGVIAEVAGRLLEAKQIAQAPGPNDVLDTLVNHHTLLLTGEGEDATVGFQHQQIQEWFASFEAERLMLEAAGGVEASRARLRIELIDRQPWEEAILFACDRLSRRDEKGKAAVAFLVEQCLTIDPMLAAEVIYRSTPDVWSMTKNKVLRLVTRWHTPDKVDRAVRFMVITGRPEFAEPLWQLLSNTNQNVYLGATRVARRFRPSVLGDDAAARLAALPAKQRENVASEIIVYGGTEGIEFVVAHAQRETDPDVLAEVIQYLHFRRADRRVKDLLQRAPNRVWEKLSECDYGDEIAGEEAGKRLAVEREKRRKAEPNKQREISELARGTLDAAALEALTTAIASPEFDFKADHAVGTLLEAFKTAPQAVAAGLVRRIEAGLPLPYSREELLDSLLVVDEGPLVSLVLDPTTETRRAIAAARTVGAKTIEKLIARLIELSPRLNTSSPQELRNEFNRLRELIKSTRPEPFLQALLTHGDSKEPDHIACLADLFAGHGRDFEKGPLEASEDNIRRFKDKLVEWVHTLLADPASTRLQFGEVAQAVARLRHPDLVDPLRRLLHEDLKRWAIAKQEFREARARGQQGPSEAYHSYVLQYGRALAAIGNPAVADHMAGLLNDPEFGLQAALVLKEISSRSQPEAAPRPLGSAWPDFSKVGGARAARQQRGQAAAATAEPIFKAIEQLCRDDGEKAHSRALELAFVALSMPHAGKDAIIDALMKLPLLLMSKRRFLLARVLAGEMLEAHLILEGFKQFLTEAQTKRWLLDESRYELHEWLELLAFSDRPLSVIEGLDLLEPPRLRDPWNHRRLLTALAHAPTMGEEVLFALAEKDPRFADQHEWLEALLRLRTDKAISGLIEIAAKPTPGRPRSMSQYELSRELAKVASERPHIRELLLRKYKQATDERTTALLEAALAENPDEDLVLLIVGRYVASKKRFDPNLRRALERVVTRHVPSTSWQGAFEIEGEPVARLRKELFKRMEGNADEQALARDCLTYIDRQRDEHGRPPAEPRHPDIHSGKPWPIDLDDAAPVTSDEEPYD